MPPSNFSTARCTRPGASPGDPAPAAATTATSADSECASSDELLASLLNSWSDACTLTPSSPGDVKVTRLASPPASAPPLVDAVCLASLPASAPPLVDAVGVSREGPATTSSTSVEGAPAGSPTSVDATRPTRTPAVICIPTRAALKCGGSTRNALLDRKFSTAHLQQKTRHLTSRRQ